MDDQNDELNGLFAPNSKLTQDVLRELQSICQLYSLDAQELYFKWESYAMKMGAESTQVTYKTIRDFRKDLEDAVDRETRAKVPQSNKKQVSAAPRHSTGGDFSMIDGMMGSTPARPGSIKRKSDWQTPASKAAKSNMNSSPMTATPTINSTSFADRGNAGQILESLNGHLAAAEAGFTPREARVKLKANTDLQKFTYKPMAMQLSAASEILDDRIDSFTELVQQHHDLPDSAFGNPAAQSTAEIVAVGRVACDQPSGKLNAASIVLETNRRMGAGMRVPLRFTDGIGYDLFPGKIVALRGTNVSGEYFTVTEVLSMPLMLSAASTPSDISIHNERLSDENGEIKPLNLQVTCGPYTTESELDFSPFYALLDAAAETKPDILLLTGPFLDLEHPIIAAGDFESHLPSDAKIDPDRATLNDVFRILISSRLSALTIAVPSMAIIMVPSVRDALSKHVSFPQNKLDKQALGLPKQVQVVTNPITLFVNEMLVGVVSEDILSELRRNNVYRASGAKYGEDMLARLSGQLIEQRHFFPVFPPQSREDAARPVPIADEVPEVGGEERLATGASVDLEYLKLAEWMKVLPDLLIVPSILTPFAKVISGVLCVNPGTLSKRRGPGTLASITVHPRQLNDEEREQELISHKIYERARVDITRI